jgi:hypothetical protein
MSRGEVYHYVVLKRARDVDATVRAWLTESYASSAPVPC